MLKKEEKFFFLVSFLLLTVTGIFYLYYRDAAPKSIDPFSVVSSPWQSWMIKLHILIAPLFVFMVGWIIAKHDLPRYSQKRKSGKKSGISNGLLLFIAISTGYLLQVFTDETNLKIVSWAHILVSMLALTAVFVHQKITEKKK